MRKILKALIAIVCVLLAVAVALLIYLGSGKRDGSDSAKTETTEAVSSAAEDSTASPETTEAVTSTAEDNTTSSEVADTEYTPVETREDGAPNYDLSNDEFTSATESEGSGVSGEAETYVPDEDELSQLPIA